MWHPVPSEAFGLLGSTGVTVTTSSVSSLCGNSYNLSSPANYAVPGIVATPCLDFAQDGTTTITFATPVSNPGLYAKYWRPGAYTLVAKDAGNNDVAYSFLSGNSTPPIAGTPSRVLCRSSTASSSSRDR